MVSEQLKKFRLATKQKERDARKRSKKKRSKKDNSIPLVNKNIQRQERFLKSFKPVSDIGRFQKVQAEKRLKAIKSGELARKQAQVITGKRQRQQTIKQFLVTNQQGQTTKRRIFINNGVKVTRDIDRKGNILRERREKGGIITIVPVQKIRQANAEIKRQKKQISKFQSDLNSQRKKEREDFFKSTKDIKNVGELFAILKAQAKANKIKSSLPNKEILRLVTNSQKDFTLLPIRVGNNLIIPTNKKHEVLLKKSQRVYNRDVKFQKRFDDAMKQSGGIVGTSDSVGIKVWKGAIATSLSIWFMFQSAARGVDKALLGVEEVFTSETSKNAKKFYTKELKAIPKKFGKSFIESHDPSKPENWVNDILLIGMIALGVRGLVKAKPNSLASNKIFNKYSKGISGAERIVRKQATKIKIQVKTKTGKLRTRVIKVPKVAMLDVLKSSKIVLKKLARGEKVSSGEFNRLISHKAAVRIYKNTLTKAKIKTSISKVQDSISLALDKAVVGNVKKLAFLSKANRLKVLKKISLLKKRFNDPSLRVNIDKLGNVVVKKPFKQRLPKVAQNLLELSKGLSNLRKSLNSKAVHKLSKNDRVISLEFKKLIKKNNGLVSKINNVKRLPSGRSQRKALIKKFKLEADKQRIEFKRLFKDAKRKEGLRLDKERRTLRKDIKASKRTPKSEKFGKKKRKELKQSGRVLGRVSLDDAAKSLKYVFDDRVKVNHVNIKKQFTELFLDKKGKISSIVINQPKSVVVAKRVGKVVRFKDIRKPILKPEGVIIDKGNGQVLVLKTVKKSLKPSLKRVSGRVTTVHVKPKVKSEINAYYTKLVLIAKQKQSLNVILKRDNRFRSLHKLYFGVLSKGIVPNSIIASLPKVKTGVKAVVISKVKHKTAQVQKQKQVQKIKFGVKTKQIQKLSFRVAQAQIKINRVHLQRLKDILRRAKRRVPKIISLNRNPNKAQKKNLDEWVKKFPIKYRPSLASVLFNITAYRVPKSITGLGLRPILIKKPKRKRMVAKGRRKK